MMKRPHNTIRQNVFSCFCCDPPNCRFLTQAYYYRPAYKVTQEQGTRQKTLPTAGIVPSFENAEISQACCPGGPSRHHARSGKRTLYALPPSPRLQAPQCLYSCAIATAKNPANGFSNLYDLPFAILFQKVFIASAKHKARK